MLNGSFTKFYTLSGRTTIVIAHRLSTIRNSDKIIGFHEGEAVESGTHEELQNVPKGIYQNLCNMQSYGAEEGMFGSCGASFFYYCVHSE